MYRQFGLGSILEKVPSGEGYTNEAILYQDIINFCMKRDQEGKTDFKHRELANWLLENNLEYLDFYKGTRAKTKKSSRVEHILQRIKDRLRDLSRIDLIRISDTPQEKGEGTTELYQITPFVILLGTLLDSIKTIDKEFMKSSDKHLYELFIKQFAEYPNSLNQFRSRFYPKLMLADIFTDFIGDGLRQILLSEDPPQSIRELLQKWHLLSQFDESRRDKVELYLKLWFESLAELDEEARNLFLFNIKVEIENQILMQSNGPQTYEKARFYNRNDYQSIVLEGLCNKCFHVQPRTIEMKGYLRLYIGAVPGQTLVLHQCVNCDEGIVVLTNI
jgi:hypothetical protein